jgi:pimeloyl-ACP methyl ester carboxylesterase
MNHDWIRTNGVRLHVVTAGPENGPLVVLLHGFPDFWYGFRRQISFLAERGFRVMAPDQRGYGESDKPAGIDAYRIEQLTADVAGLIDAAGRDKAHVVGHDWGGGVAWMLAVRNPEKVDKLAVLNAPHPVVMMKTLGRSLDQLRRSWYIFVFQLPFLPEKALTARGGRRLFDGIAAEAAPGAFTPDDYPHYREAWARPGAATGMIHWYRAMFRQRRSIPPEAQARIRMPALLVWGTAEKHIVRSMAEDSIAFCDQGRLELIEGASHWVHADAPDRVNALLEGFLKTA